MRSHSAHDRSSIDAKTYRGSQGFTLIELLIVIAIVGILAAFAALRPPNQGAKTYANDVRVIVQQARFEAVNRNVPVSVAWEEGELRFAAYVGSVDEPCSDDEIIVGRSASEYRDVEVAFDDDKSPTLLWLPSGQARSCNFAPFPGTIARVSSEGAATRVVNVSLTGKVTVVQ